MKHVDPSLLVAVLLTLAGPAAAATLHVPAVFPTIAEGVAASASGDTVVVACGRYEESGIALRGGITVRSATGDSSCVTIDGLGTSPIFTLTAEADSVRLVGLGFTGGVDAVRVEEGVLYGEGLRFLRNRRAIKALQSTVTLTECSFEENRSTEQGGAVQATGTTLWLESCSFAGNGYAGELDRQRRAGGAVHAGSSHVTARHCDFHGNDHAQAGGALRHEYGLETTLLSCTLSENRSLVMGGAVSVDGPALVEDCTFYHNVSGGGISTDIFSVSKAAGHGGALYLGGSAAVMVRGSLFIANEAPDGWGSTTHGGVTSSWDEPGEGGAIWRGEVGLQIERCTFHANEGDRGSSVYGPLELESCLITQGRAGAPLRANGDILLRCCDLYANGGGDWVEPYAEQWFRDGNFSADPLYCESDSLDVRLAANSPCLPANNPWGCTEVVGALGEGCDAQPGLSERLLSLELTPGVLQVQIAVRFDTRSDVVGLFARAEGEGRSWEIPLEFQGDDMYLATDQSSELACGGSFEYRLLAELLSGARVDLGSAWTEVSPASFLSTLVSYALEPGPGEIRLEGEVQEDDLVAGHRLEIQKGELRWAPTLEWPQTGRFILLDRNPELAFGGEAICHFLYDLVDGRTWTVRTDTVVVPALTAAELVPGFLIETDKGGVRLSGGYQAYPVGTGIDVFGNDGSVGWWVDLQWIEPNRFEALDYQKAFLLGGTAEYIVYLVLAEDGKKQEILRQTVEVPPVTVADVLPEFHLEVGLGEVILGGRLLPRPLVTGLSIHGLENGAEWEVELHWSADLIFTAVDHHPSFVDGGNPEYQVGLVLSDGSTVEILSTKALTDPAPLVFATRGLLPNPVLERGVLQMSSDRPRWLTAQLYDLRGRKVATVADQLLRPGWNDIPWEARGDDGERLAAGVYLLRLHSERDAITRKVVLLRR